MATGMRDWVNKFLRLLRQEKRYSPHTVSNYRRDLRLITEFLTSRGIESWSALDHQQVRAYVAFRHKLKLSGRTIQRELSSLRAFFGSFSVSSRSRTIQWWVFGPLKPKKNYQRYCMLTKWIGCWPCQPAHR